MTRGSSPFSTLSSAPLETFCVLEAFLPACLRVSVVCLPASLVSLARERASRVDAQSIRMRVLAMFIFKTQPRRASVCKLARVTVLTSPRCRAEPRSASKQ